MTIMPFIPNQRGKEQTNLHHDGTGSKQGKVVIIRIADGVKSE